MNHFLLNLYLIACLVLFLVVIWIQHNRRTVMLFTTRNIFLVGFAYFQIISVMYWVADPDLYAHFWRVDKPNYAVKHYVAMSSLFLLCFFVAYHRFNFVKKHSQRFIFRSGASNDTFLLMLAVVMSVLSVSMQLGAANRYIAILGHYVGISMGAAACGIAAWVLTARYSNPIMVVYCAIIIGMNMVGQLGGFSRRGLLSMGLAILWSIFYRYIHTKRTGQLAGIFLIIFLPSFLVVSAFTGIREWKGMSQKEAVSRINVDSIKAGAHRLVGPTDTGPITLWLIENYPRNFSYRHMFTPMYTFGHFVPRAWWKDKPDPLGMLVVDQARLGDAAGELNVGPGIIGHAAAEGGYYAVVVYALLLAFLTRSIDDLAKLNNTNVYVAVPIGCALAELFAAARGETSNMLGIGACGTLGVFLFMMLLVRVTGARPPTQAVMYVR